MRNWLKSLILVGVLPFAGCNFFNNPDNPAVVLEGTWQVNLDEPGDLAGFEIQLTFDANGELVEVTAESPAGGTARLDVLDGATTSEVDGDQVTITVPIGAGTRVIEGTLSEDENTIDGSLSQELELSDGDLEITIPGGDLTLTRVVS